MFFLRYKYIFYLILELIHTTMKKILLWIIAIFFLTSCGGNSNVDIINPDAQYLYFYGATCPHCQELNRKIKEVWWIEQFSIEKREVYYNAENNKLFLQTAKDLNIPEDKIGVPFILEKATSQYVIGVEPALEMLSKSLQNTSINSNETTE